MKQNRAYQPSHADYLEAHKDIFRQGLGLNVANPHPLAAATGGLTFAQLAESLMEVRGHDVDRYRGDPHRLVPMALATTELPEVLQNGLGEHIATRKSPALEKTLALTAPAEAPTYDDLVLYIADVAALPSPSNSTTNAYHAVKPILSAQSVRVHSLHGNLIVPIQLAVNGPEDYLKSSLNASMNACHCNGMKDGIVGILESNPTMPDGTAMFHADHGNLTVAPLDATGLGTAFSTLRKQTTEGGNLSDANPHALLVHSDDEVAALALVETLPEQNRPMVIASSYLADATSWYLFSDPEIHPVICRVLMEGAPVSGFVLGYPGPAFEIKPDGKRADIPGFMVPFSYTVGFAALSHVGVVKLNKS